MKALLLISLVLMWSSLSFAAPLSTKPAAIPPNPPNFVFILVDDTGWNALSIPADPEIPESGSTYFQTPNMGRLAESGIRFSRAYRPEAFADSGKGARIEWGVQIGKQAKSLPFLERFDLEEIK